MVLHPTEKAVPKVEHRQDPVPAFALPSLFGDLLSELGLTVAPLLPETCCIIKVSNIMVQK